MKNKEGKSRWDHPCKLLDKSRWSPTRPQGPVDRDRQRGGPTLTSLDNRNICTTCDNKPRSSEDPGVGGRVHSEPLVSPTCLHMVSGSERAPSQDSRWLPPMYHPHPRNNKVQGKKTFVSLLHILLRSPCPPTLLLANAGLLCLIGQK